MTCRKCVKEPSLYNPHLVTKELNQPPVMTIVSPSGIPQAPSPVCASSNFSPPWKKQQEYCQAALKELILGALLEPGTISAVYAVVFRSSPPRMTIESRGEGGAHAT